MSTFAPICRSVNYTSATPACSEEVPFFTPARNPSSYALVAPVSESSREPITTGVFRPNASFPHQYLASRNSGPNEWVGVGATAAVVVGGLLLISGVGSPLGAGILVAGGLGAGAVGCAGSSEDIPPQCPATSPTDFQMISSPQASSNGVSFQFRNPFQNDRSVSYVVYREEIQNGQVVNSVRLMEKNATESVAFGMTIEDQSQDVRRPGVQFRYTIVPRRGNQDCAYAPFSVEITTPDTTRCSSPGQGVQGLPRTEDTDCDGIPNNRDNCATQANPRQEDGDHDQIGDACESARCIATPAPFGFSEVTHTVGVGGPVEAPARQLTINAVLPSRQEGRPAYVAIKVGPSAPRIYPIESGSVNPDSAGNTYYRFTDFLSRDRFVGDVQVWTQNESMSYNNCPSSRVWSFHLDLPALPVPTASDAGTQADAAAELPPCTSRGEQPLVAQEADRNAQSILFRIRDNNLEPADAYEITALNPESFLHEGLSCMLGDSRTTTARVAPARDASGTLYLRLEHNGGLAPISICGHDFLIRGVRNTCEGRVTPELQVYVP